MGVIAFLKLKLHICPVTATISELKSDKLKTTKKGNANLKTVNAKIE